MLPRRLLLHVLLRHDAALPGIILLVGSCSSHTAADELGFDL